MDEKRCSVCFAVEVVQLSGWNIRQSRREWQSLRAGISPSHFQFGRGSARREVAYPEGTRAENGSGWRSSRSRVKFWRILTVFKKHRSKTIRYRKFAAMKPNAQERTVVRKSSWARFLTLTSYPNPLMSLLVFMYSNMSITRGESWRSSGNGLSLEESSIYSFQISKRSKFRYFIHTGMDLNCRDIFITTHLPLCDVCSSFRTIRKSFFASRPTAMSKKARATLQMNSILGWESRDFRTPSSLSTHFLQPPKNEPTLRPM